MKHTHCYFARLIFAGSLLFLLLAGGRSTFAQVFVNGSFETSDFQGWTVTFTGDIRVDRDNGVDFEHDVVYPYDVSTVPLEYVLFGDVFNKVQAQVLTDSGVARNGSSYANLAGNYFYYPSWEMPDGYTYHYYGANPLRLEQTVHLLGGQTITGWLNYINGCYLDEHNGAYAYVNDMVVWDFMNADLPSSEGWSDGDLRSTGWVQWSHTVTTEGDYTIAFDVLPQCEFHGWLQVDDVQVVPEPSSLALWGGLALALCRRVRRKR